MSLLGRLRMLGSSKIFLLSCKLSGAQRLPMQPCQTANTPAIQLQGQRIGAGAEGPGMSSCYNFCTAPLVAPWDSTGESLLCQQGHLADQPSHN